MRLETRAFGLAGGIVAAVLFTVCALAVAVAPGPTTALASYLIHMDLSGMQRSMTIDRFVGGLVLWVLGAAIVLGCLAALYNWLADRLTAVQRVPGARPAVEGMRF